MSNPTCKLQRSPVLTTDVPQLHTMVNELQSQVNYLKEQLQLAIRGQFGSKADVVNLDQMPLFVGSETAGRNAAILYSLVETCKANKINPLSYLTYALEELSNLGRHPQHDALEKLLPYTKDNIERFKLGS